MEKGVSVLICSYNSAGRIDRTIAHLAAQHFDMPMAWEIIFIDNASTDDCGRLAESAWEKSGPPNTRFRVIREDKAGKVYALNLGVSLALYEYFIICDDDNWLAPDYVQTVFNILENHTDTGAVGGRGVLATEGQSPPDWFPRFEKHYAIGEQDTVSGDVTRTKGYLWGAGMASRTMLYRDMYIRVPSFLGGRKENEIVGGGEDTEYCLRLVLKGWRLRYESRLVFEHFMPNRRLTPEYRDHLVKSQDNDLYVLEKYYLAIKMQNKTSGRPLNKLRLLIMTPLKWLFARSDKKKWLEENKLRILYPFKEESDPVLYSIKKFINLP